MNAPDRSNTLLIPSNRTHYNYPSHLFTTLPTLYILTTTHPIAIINTNIPTHKPLCTPPTGFRPAATFVTAIPLVLGLELEVELVPVALLPLANPRQLAMLKNMSMLPYTPPKSSWQGPMAKTGTSVRECTPWGSLLGLLLVFPISF